MTAPRRRVEPIRLPGVSPYALALAAMPALVARLLEQHRPDPDGFCHVCRYNRAGGVDGEWPCNISSTASAAARVNAIAHEQRRTG